MTFVIKFTIAIKIIAVAKSRVAITTKVAFNVITIIIITTATTTTASMIMSFIKFIIIITIVTAITTEHPENDYSHRPRPPRTNCPIDCHLFITAATCTIKPYFYYNLSYLHFCYSGFINRMSSYFGQHGRWLCHCRNDLFSF